MLGVDGHDGVGRTDGRDPETGGGSPDADPQPGLMQVVADADLALLGVQQLRTAPAGHRDQPVQR